MKTIHKYQVGRGDIVNISMPKGAQILTVELQHGVACIWAAVDTDEPMVLREIHVYGTGHKIMRNDLRYIGTILMIRGELVFHLFDGGEL